VRRGDLAQGGGGCFVGDDLDFEGAGLAFYGWEFRFGQGAEHGERVSAELQESWLAIEKGGEYGFFVFEDYV